LDRIVRDAPGDVMHRADAPRSARFVRHLADLDVLSGSAAFAAVPLPAVLLAEIREPEHSCQESGGRRAIAFPHTHRVQPKDLSLGRNWALVPGAMQSFVTCLDEREELAVRIGQHDRPITATTLGSFDLCAVLREPVVPVVVTSGGNRQRDLDTQSDTQSTWRRMTE